MVEREKKERSGMTAQLLFSLHMEQFGRCWSCFRGDCPPEAVLAAKMDPKTFVCELWKGYK